MGLFDFFKKKKEVADDLYEQSAAQPYQQDDTTNITPSRLQDFLSFNLSAIPVYKWTKYDDYTSNYGVKVQKYKHVISDPNKYEMGTFDMLDLTVSNDRPHTLRLYSTSNNISVELIDLIQFCVDKLGDDDLGKGALTDRDVDAAKQGRLGRIWDQVSLRQKEVNGNTAIELTLVLAKLNM